MAGGTSGIGFAVAEAAARAGAAVIIASSRPERVAAPLERLPHGTRGESLDFTDEGQVRAFFARVGTLDHFVYTAGESLLLQSLAELGIDDAQRAFEVRYWGALKAVKYAAPLIRAGGSITLASGVASSRPLAGRSRPVSWAQSNHLPGHWPSSLRRCVSTPRHPVSCVLRCGTT